MKNTFLMMSCLMITVVLFPLRVDGAPAHDGGASFNSIEGKVWLLSEFRAAGKTVRINRNDGNTRGIYTIGFQDGGQVNGMGAPNRFFGPYTNGGNRALSIGNLASTMMASLWEPEELKEREYFGFLSRVTRWDLREGKLELHSTNENAAEVILIFDRE
jgi:heat shock protein HslJ